jgi:hypothetical protein
MKKITTLILISIALFTANIASAEVRYYAASADVILVKSQPAVGNFEVYSLANTRDAINATQARIQAEIMSSVKGELSQTSSTGDLGEAS